MGTFICCILEAIGAFAKTPRRSHAKTPGRKGMIRSAKFCSPSGQSTEGEQQHDRSGGEKPHDLCPKLCGLASWREIQCALA
jgi:hypothetical protein